MGRILVSNPLTSSYCSILTLQYAAIVNLFHRKTCI